ncbi:3-oxo-5-alpha-steroid 4-dehydrogenase [Blastocystis sp. subtype 4]|uniref:3-oxo-5-alpha-steroid 4-dehydrogenase n=1 Tax=Blastocystis sp. subtype 4 TaxID=944170 RepID=UPI0007121094|nr:3-oxo-5-alpha-steroid 4-dehydrogenase [Blastocystis sp. subtype 4]KNB43371.1 3-oxo-5-alpha-steroid 4-dehydrogenase [Blastocystis sp. subtype 4]|eukprot:XP_014526814.1 3-oxo-5-alpha-steroid 4-dehydrogenase [Blastocystis sp. subtype 4]
MKIMLTEKEPLRLTNDGMTFSDYNVKMDSHIVLRDIGPQIGYRDVLLLFVFVFEYAGPLVIMLILAMRPSFIYGSCDKHLSETARLAVIAWTLHYAKRLFETFFVHKFSHGTMPLTNLFKNCTYYWGYALFVGYTLCHPLYTPVTNKNVVIVALVGMFLCECVNGAVHLQFCRMRKADGSQERPIPMGPLFKFVSCPNYFAEICSWIFFTILTHSLPSLLFTLTGFLQMYVWAVKKHKGYLKTYGDTYKKLHRKALIPFLL